MAGMEGMNVDGTPFNVIMEQAVKLKTHQSAQDRRQFDSWPRFYQNSMFARDEVVAARALTSFDARLAAAQALKEEGNALFRAHKAMDAAFKYEAAAAVFRWLENHNPNWKKEGIKDCDIEAFEFSPEDDDEAAAVQALLCSAYLNFAACQLRLSEYQACKDACSTVLELDPDNVKALYRRAQALLLPPSAGGVEQEAALRDLQRAARAAPEDSAVRRELAKLKADMKQQRRADRETFSGMFERGEVYSGSGSGQPAAESQAPQMANRPAESMEDLERQLHDAEQIARVHEENGRAEEAADLRAKVAEARAQIAEARDKARREAMDFSNPSPQMVEDARKQGIDLTDPEVVEMLRALQEEKEAEERGEAPPVGAGGGRRISTAAIAKSMSMKELIELLDDAGVDHTACRTKEDLEALARVELGKMQQEGGGGAAGAAARAEMAEVEARKRKVWIGSFSIAFIAVIYRLYSMGLLGKLYSAAVASDPSDSYVVEEEEVEDEWGDDDW